MATKSDKKYESILTPVGTAHYPRLAEPDDIDDKFKLSLELSDDDAEAMAQRMKDAAKTFATTDKIPMKSKEGVTLFTFKSKKRPKVVDASNKAIPPEVRIGGGSKVRIRGSLAPYDGFGGGVTAYLNAVQVIELADGAGGFEATDGYRYDGGGDDTPF